MRQQDLRSLLSRPTEESSCVSHCAILSTGGSREPRNLPCPKLYAARWQILAPDISCWLIAAYERIPHPHAACVLRRFTVFCDDWGSTCMYLIPLNVASGAASHPSVYTLHVRLQDSKSISGKDEPRTHWKHRQCMLAQGLLCSLSSVALGSVLLLSQLQDVADD